MQHFCGHPLFINFDIYVKKTKIIIDGFKWIIIPRDYLFELVSDFN